MHDVHVGFTMIISYMYVQSCTVYSICTCMYTMNGVGIVKRTFQKSESDEWRTVVQIVCRCTCTCMTRHDLLLHMYMYIHVVYDLCDAQSLQAHRQKFLILSQSPATHPHTLTHHTPSLVTHSLITRSLITHPHTLTHHTLTLITYPHTLTHHTPLHAHSSHTLTHSHSSHTLTHSLITHPHTLTHPRQRSSRWYSQRE